MKIATITDLHFGARSDSDRVAEHQAKFYRDVLFPYMKDNDITELFILGDVFDRRKYINFKTLARAKEMLFDECLIRGINVQILAGNHDIFHSGHSDINSLDLLLDYPNVKIYSIFPAEIKMGSLWMGIVPWINTETRSHSMEFLKNTLCPVILGHFDINGFEMNPGITCDNGEDPKIFSKFEAVYTGHYHKKMNNGNITYLGTQYDMDWGDYGVPKFFHVLDTETRKLTAIENPHRIFVKLHYRDSLVETSPDINGKYVKLVVLKKGDPYLFDMCVSELKNQNPETFTILETVEENITITQSAEGEKSTLNIISDYITDMKSITPEHKKSVYNVLSELYTEANSLGVFA